MKKIEILKFRFLNSDPTISNFLENLKEFKNYELKLRRLEIFGG